MEVKVSFIQGQCFPPTNRSEKYGPKGHHFSAYSQSDLDIFMAGTDPMREHSKMNVTATIFDEKRGSGHNHEITPDDVIRLEKAGTPVGEIVFNVNGSKADPKSANDTNRFNTRIDVVGSSLSVTATCEGVTSPALTIPRVVPPDYPTRKGEDGAWGGDDDGDDGDDQ